MRSEESWLNAVLCVKLCLYFSFYYFFSFDTGLSVGQTCYKTGLKTPHPAGHWWHTPLIPANRRQRQADLCEFEASLVSRANARKGSKKLHRETLSPKNKTNKQKTQINPWSIAQCMDWMQHGSNIVWLQDRPWLVWVCHSEAASQY